MTPEDKELLERLRDLDDLEPATMAADRLEALGVENARLREALRGLLSIPIGPMPMADAKIVLEINRPLYEAARAALDQEPSPGKESDGP